MKPQKPSHLDVRKQNFAADEALEAPKSVHDKLQHKAEVVGAIKSEDQVLQQENQQGVDQAKEVEVLKDEAQNDQKDYILAGIGYLYILCLLPLFLRPKSEFCQFHGKQSLAIFISIIVYQSVSWLFISNISMGAGLFMVHFLIRLGFLGAIGWGIFSALTGKKTEIRPFSYITRQFKW